MEPVYTKGNVFWRGDQRFLIKGISYIPHTQEADRRSPDSLIDPLTDDRLFDLERDIPVLKQLGLNTIQVMGLDPTRSHDKAMKLLADSGIYIFAELCSKMKMPDRSTATPAFDPSRYYTLALMRRAFRTVDQLATHPNLLGFSVDVSRLSSGNITKMAESYRAAVRDVKAFLTLRQGRKPPVGVHVCDNQSLRMQMLQYFTAGSLSERVDFFGFDCYSWASPSNFQVSGWSNMVQVWQNFPVPAFLAEYGTNIRQRTWGEVGCLYSPDMTGVFSGGCVYTYFERGNNYGIVQIGENREVERRPDFVALRDAFAAVNARATNEVHGEEVMDYEGWMGTFPPLQGQWHATATLPDLPASVYAMFEEIEKEKAQLLAEEVSKLDLRDVEVECRLPAFQN